MRHTSMRAYFEEILPTLAPRYKQILEMMADEGEPMTNMEIAEALKWSINRVTGRIKELREEKILEDAGVRVCKITGREVHAWYFQNRETLF